MFGSIFTYSNVSVLCYHGKNTMIYDVEKVKEKYNVESKYIADYKSLIGDKSDNIKVI
jgi:DNA polymerase-1